MERLGNPHLIQDVADLPATSRRNTKCNLKCISSELILVLSDIANPRSYANFRMMVETCPASWLTFPVLSTTTLLIPGYLDAREMTAITRFIVDLDDTILYNRLTFTSHDWSTDLSMTLRSQVLAYYLTAMRRL